MCCVKVYIRSYKYNGMDIVTSMMLTYSSLKLTDTLLFALSVVICIKTSLSKFSIQKDQVPLPHMMFPVRECVVCIL
jgi:hypothetical protein